MKTIANVRINKNNFFTGVTYANNAEPIANYSSVTSLCISNGINEHAGSGFQFNIFPNPSSEKITVEFFSTQSDYALLEMSDMLGQVLISEKVKMISGKNSSVFDLGTFAGGIYLLLLKNADSNLTMRKI